MQGNIHNLLFFQLTLCQIGNCLGKYLIFKSFQSSCYSSSLGDTSEVFFFRRATSTRHVMNVFKMQIFDGISIKCRSSSFHVQSYRSNGMWCDINPDPGVKVWSAQKMKSIRFSRGCSKIGFRANRHRGTVADDNTISDGFLKNFKTKQ